MKKQKLLVSFSGGETSAYMAKWLIDNKSDEYEMAFVFANTGEENEETLNFVNRCDKEWNLGVVWVEAKVNPENGKGTRHKIVNYQTASRKGEPFEDVIKKYGIPNQNFPHCNRELKLHPIHSYIKTIGWKNYYTAIGIRADEFDRVSSHRIKNKLIYPFIEFKRMSKQKINHWWSKQPFRLNLKGYQTNCKACWKKNIKKLHQIAKEDKRNFDFVKAMESKYGQNKYTFFREGKSANEIVKESSKSNEKIRDVHQDSAYQIDLFDMIDDVESCDIYSNCGDL